LPSSPPKQYKPQATKRSSASIVSGVLRFARKKITRRTRAFFRLYRVLLDPAMAKILFLKNLHCVGLKSAGKWGDRLRAPPLTPLFDDQLHAVHQNWTGHRF